MARRHIRTAFPYSIRSFELATAQHTSTAQPACSRYDDDPRRAHTFKIAQRTNELFVRLFAAQLKLQSAIISRARVCPLDCYQHKRRGDSAIAVANSRSVPVLFRTEGEQMGEAKEVLSWQGFSIIASVS